MNNSLKSRPKKSKIELQTNNYIIVTVAIQMVICLSSAAYNCIWIKNYGFNIPYLGFAYDTESQSGLQAFVVSFMLWFIALMNFVSISLLVTLEMVKLMQGYFIEQDWMLYDIEKDLSAKVQSSNLNEELGMVSYIFSDKTGTLTQNIMEFQKLTAGGVSYGKSNPRKCEYAPGVTNVNFEDDTFFEHLNNPTHPQHEHIFKFVECLGICHTVISEEKELKGQKCRVYNASSPDELALVNGCRNFGFSFIDRDLEDNIVVSWRDKEFKYKLLHLIEFNSDRKRMSVIVRTEDGRVLIVCKGADSIINARLLPNQPH